MGILAAKAGFPYACREGNIASFFSSPGYSPGIRSPTRVWGRAFAILSTKGCNTVSHMRVGKTTRSLRFRRPREGAYLCKKQPNIMKKQGKNHGSPTCVGGNLPLLKDALRLPMRVRKIPQAGAHPLPRRSPPMHVGKA